MKNLNRHPQLPQQEQQEQHSKTYAGGGAVMLPPVFASWVTPVLAVGSWLSHAGSPYPDIVQ